MNYSLAELALMTGYSARSLRKFYRQGILIGTKTAGRHVFSQEDVERFAAQPFIQSGIQTKAAMRVRHFLEEEHTRQPSSCLIYDQPGEARAGELNGMLLHYINRECGGELAYTYLYDAKKDVGRFVFIGQPAEIAAVLQRIGEGHMGETH